MSIKLMLMLIEEHIYYNPDYKWIICGIVAIYSAVIWVILSISVAVAANRYKRTALAYFLLSVFFSPLVGVAFLIARGPGERYTPRADSAPAASVSPSRPRAEV
jgi:hypothetical protein